ncbi:MAG TPA: DUF4446 family protein [Patescibacteria group bacterium]|jgi:hypothetical protein|nr:DUF4446 family protein [Patescibacteria group bacterium]
MEPVNLSYFNLGLSVLLLLCFCWMLIRLQRLDKVRQQFFSSGIKRNLEEVLVDQNRKLTSLTENLDSLSKNLNELQNLNQANIQKIGFIRFNPFDDAGGNMSFALSLLNAEDNGIVISSLHSREGTRIYAKAVKKGNSDSKLTEEELKAISQAK